MTRDALRELREAAPYVPPSSDSARLAAYRAAVALPAVPTPSANDLRRWWLAGVAALASALLVVAGTAIPASGTTPVPPPLGPSTGMTPPATTDLYLTRPDGSVYVVTKPYR